MSQHPDNGSFTGGFTMAIVAFLCFIIGYFVRDNGVTFHIQENQPVAPINRNSPNY